MSFLFFNSIYFFHLLFVTYLSNEITKYSAVIKLQQHIRSSDGPFDAHALSMVEHLIGKQLTSTSRCLSAPMTVGHAGLSPDSLQVVPSVTVVGHCGFKGYTRDTSLTICRS